MTRHEKRYFKMKSKSAGRGETIYVALFDYLNTHRRYNEAEITRKIPQLKKAQISNVKASLYRHLLRAIRDTNKSNYIEIEAREKLDFAKVLYAKGHYDASNQMLQQAKKISIEIENKGLLYAATLFEKEIERQHVMRALSPRTAELSRQSREVAEDLLLTDQLSSLSLSLYGIYMQRGLARSEEDVAYLTSYLDNHMPDIESEDELDFHQRLHLYQSLVWYYHMLQDFDSLHHNAKRWVDLFTVYPVMIKVEARAYISGLNSLLNTYFLTAKTTVFDRVFHQLRAFSTSVDFDLSRNEASLLSMAIYTHGLNQVFLTTRYRQGLQLVDELITALSTDDYAWDLHRRMTLYYKIACVYYGNAMLEECMTYLHKIINYHYPDLHEDIQCFARILHLIVHFDLGNEVLVSYQVRSLYRYLHNMKEMQAVQREILRFLRRTTTVNRSDLQPAFQVLKDKLLVLRKDKVERRPFAYLDIISYLDSKINGVSMVQAIRDRRGIVIKD